MATCARRGQEMFIYMIIGLCLTEFALFVSSLETKDVLFIVVSQKNRFHLRKSEEFKTDFEKQFPEKSELKDTKLLLTHKEWPNVNGAWTIIPLLEDIKAKYGELLWVFVCEEDTRLKVKPLIKALQQHDATKELFLGKPLVDKEATIIHHFSFYDDPSKFSFPDFAAGFALSMPLVNSLVKRLKEDKLKSDFSIDAKHELAMFIWNDGKGQKLEELPGLCTTEKSPDCVTSYTVKFPNCGEPVDEDDVYIAVKTCKKFHWERVPIVQQTWGRDVKNLEYISEEVDENIPTISLGVPNTERGHCGKTMAILKRFNTDEKYKDKNWILIADDDTIISLPRLRKFLACYDPSEPVAIGEQYGYGVSSGFGYNYITGGGGMVFSQSAVTELLKECSCGSDDSPDDMVLGMCLSALDIPISHSGLFHQARPDDYSEGYLQRQIPISFHKHWNNDPVKIYKEWFEDKKHTIDEL